jgi:flagellar protein FliS
VPVDEVRERYLRDRVMTATPAQRVVMLYDRLGVDLTLAEGAEDAIAAGTHLGHALQVVAELHSSLNVAAGGPADNLSSIYTYLLQELLAARGGDSARVGGARMIVAELREAWAQASEQVSAHAVSAAAGAWVG